MSHSSVSQRGDTYAVYAPQRIAPYVEDHFADSEMVSLRLNQLQTIHHITDVVSHVDTLDAVYQEALFGMQRLLGVRRAALLLCDADRVMRFRAWSGVSPEYRSTVEGHSPWPPDDHDPQPILVSDAWKEPLLRAWHEHFVRENIRGVASFPLRYQGRLLGKFMVYYDQPHDFDTVEVRLAETIANQVAFATERQRVEDALRQANQQLTAWVAKLEQRTHEISLLNEMGDKLQTSMTLDDAYAVIADFTQALFATAQGALYILNPEHNLMEAVVAWGNLPHAGRRFPPDACWALRHGRACVMDESQRGLSCQHISTTDSHTYLCVPLLAQNETLGILHIELNPGAPALLHDDEGQFNEANEKLAVALADHAALALANLRLRETLRSQAIRDPLTGLFNRRYMEETLTREVHRAARRGTTLGIIMLDIDHLKHVNDSFGHQAGDAMLRALGEYLQNHTRGEDIACRYGGDEFILILPETPLSVLEQRADQLRIGITRLEIEHYRAMIGQVTLSAGVAIFPDHGLTGDAVLRAADTALYRAKTDGRNRIFTAGAADAPPARA